MWASFLSISYPKKSYNEIALNRLLKIFGKCLGCLKDYGNCKGRWLRSKLREVILGARLKVKLLSRTLRRVIWRNGCWRNYRIKVYYYYYINKLWFYKRGCDRRIIKIDRKCIKKGKWTKKECISRGELEN